MVLYSPPGQVKSGGGAFVISCLSTVILILRFGDGAAVDDICARAWAIGGLPIAGAFPRHSPAPHYTRPCPCRWGSWATPRPHERGPWPTAGDGP